VKQVKAMGIQQVLGAPWQRAYVERVIGTIRRECLDQMIVFSEAGLSRHLRKFAGYYHWSRTHLSLEKDTPESRPVQGREAGRIVAIPEVGGLQYLEHQNKSHARRYCYKALDSDQSHMGPALLLIAQLYRVEKQGPRTVGGRSATPGPVGVTSHPG
jgi:hypothetical protein